MIWLRIWAFILWSLRTADWYWRTEWSTSAKLSISSWSAKWSDCPGGEVGYDPCGPPWVIFIRWKSFESLPSIYKAGLTYFLPETKLSSLSSIAMPVLTTSVLILFIVLVTKRSLFLTDSFCSFIYFSISLAPIISWSFAVSFSSSCASSQASCASPLNLFLNLIPS